MMSSVVSQSGIHKVFVYGSLMADEVVAKLLNRIPLSSPATLPNFKRFSVKGRVYPAILPVEKEEVTGRVLLGISDSELDTLDVFEDVEYERSSINVSLLSTNEKIQAWTYVWANKTDPNLYGDWDFRVWEEEHKNDFLAMTAGFMEELEGPKSKHRVETYESFYQHFDDEKKP